MIAALKDRALQKQSPVFDTAKIPSVSYFIAFLSGYLTYTYIRNPLSLFVFVLLLFFLSLPYIKKLNLLIFTAVIVIFTVGYVFGFISIRSAVNNYGGIHEKKISANLRIDSEIEYRDEYIRFIGEFVNTKYSGDKCLITLYDSDGYDISIGDVFRIKDMELKSQVPYNISEQILYSSNRISDRIFLYAVSHNSDIVKIAEGGFSLTAFFNDVKLSIREVLNKYLDKNQFDFISGILTGYRDNTNTAFNDMLSVTGISHIVVVSGLHFSIIIYLLLYILRSFRISPGIASFITIIFSFAIALFFGITPSVLRALIMTDILLFADILRRDKTSYFHYLFVTASIMIIANPFIIYDVGFVLSFSSILGIRVFSDKIYNKIKYLPASVKGVLSTTVSANLITIPICAFYFNTVSLLFLFGNLLVTPLVSVFMVYSVIAVIITSVFGFTGSILFTPLNFVLKILFVPLNLISKITFLNFKVISPSVTAILAYYTALCITQIDTERKAIKAASCILLSVYFITNLFIPENSILFGKSDIYSLTGRESGRAVVNSGGTTVVCDLSGSSYSYSLKNVLDKTSRSKADAYIISDVNSLDVLYELSDGIKISKVIYPANFGVNVLFTEKLSNIDCELIPSYDNLSLNVGNLILTIKCDNNYNIIKVEIEGERDTLNISKDMEEEFGKEELQIFSYDKLNFLKYNGIELTDNVIHSDSKSIIQESIK